MSSLDRLSVIVLAGLAAILLVGSPMVSIAQDRSLRRGIEPRVEQLRGQGVEHYRKREYFQAIQAFEAALKLAQPSRAAELKELIARAHSSMGVELFNSGELRQAEQSFLQALEQAEDAYAHFGLGFLHFVRLEDAEAIRHLKEARRLEPGYAKTHKVLAVIDYRQGRVDDALAGMQKAAGLAPRDEEATALYRRWKAETSFTSRFREERAGRFLIRSDPELSAARVREISARIVKIGRGVAHSFQLASPPETVVVLFSGERFHRATGSFHWVGGMYDGQVKIPVEATAGGGGDDPDGGVEDDPGALDAVLRHELSHVMVRAICPEVPNWLNEGIAQHFEQPEDLGDVRLQLRRHRAKRLRFQDVPARLWEVEDQEIARLTYLQALDFVEFLVARFHEFRLRLLLEAIHREGSVSEGFRLTYGWDLEESESRWWQEVEGPAGAAGSAGGPPGEAD